MLRNTLLTTLTLLIAQSALAAEGETKPAADKCPRSTVTTEVVYWAATAVI